MSDIPDDIRSAAEKVVERGYDEGLIDAVCRALMAERERCAKIARMWLADWEGLPVDNVPAGKYAADAVKDILDAIRRGTA